MVQKLLLTLRYVLHMQIDDEIYRFLGMKKNVQDMTQGKTLKTWVWVVVQVASIHLVVAVSNTHSTLKGAFLADLGDSIFDCSEPLRFAT